MRTFTITPTSTAVPEEHVVLCRAYGAVQERCSRVMAQQQADIARLEAQVVHLRAAVILRDTALMLAREQAREGASRAGAAPRMGSILALRLHAWRQWPLRAWRGPDAARQGTTQAAATLATADVLGRQGSWLSPWLDWPG